MTRPTSPSERFTILDVLRGFALLGVILANLASHSGYFFLSDSQKKDLDLIGLDEPITWLLHFLIDGKFYSLFSLLFGIGFALQLKRAEENGVPFGGKFRRRLLILFLIGLAHAILFYVGDILTVYAITGMFLLLFRKASDKALLRLAAILLFLPVIQYAFFWFPALSADRVTDNGGNPFFEQVVANYRGGSLSDILATNVGGLIFGRYPDLFFTGRFFRVLAMFLIGYFVARRLLFIPSDPQRTLLKKVLIAGAVIGIPFNIALAIVMHSNAYYGLEPAGILQPLVYAYGVPALSLAYASAIALLYEVPRWRKPLNVFAPVGQMALTNYLMQSVICCMVFVNYGLGWFASVGVVLQMLIALGIFGFQVIFSKWWLSRYQFGPMEWLWRSLTYRTWQPLGREAVLTPLK